MLFPDYEILKAKYPNYDYSYVTNCQVNPSDLPLPYKAILDCGYVRESFGSTTFRELMGSSLFGGVENILAGVPSFNMAFDEAIRISPNFVKPYSNKGIVLGEMGDKRGAEQWFKKAL